MSKAKRLELQAELEGYLEGQPRVSNPSDHVSFQPNESTKLLYPHIVYSRDPAYKVHADNNVYFRRDKYEMTFITSDPDSPVFEELDDRPYCSHKTSFVLNGLHHAVYDIYN